ncbi:MAG: nucleoside hydrolase [Clostridia bacterium]|nr:nucleoside hydrolase [Clostridia bacterium]
MKKQIILDVDTGIDDAVAIAMALYDSKLNVKLITCIAGNLSVNEVTKNTLNFIQAINKRNIVVATGAKKPLFREKDNSIQAHGKKGLGNYKFPPLELAPCKKIASEKMYEVLSHSKTPIDIISLGPMTNIAQLLLDHPDIKEKIGVILVSGGLLSDHKYSKNRYLGFNVMQDPESAKIVFKSGVKIAICPSDMGHTAFLTPDEVQKTKETNKTGEMLEFIFRSYKDRHVKVGIATHDPCAVVCHSHPEYFTWDDMYVHIHFLESANTGVIDFDENSDKPNMMVVTGVDIKKFKQHYFKTLKKMP